ncbi:unnamed protein product [Orchesella dallaii]|uniref:Uncharacterized protein n=1 Tax=Orchesella dallaii TaxID=48710 RepID=A0ABP1R9J8_9HEXA
MKIAIFLIVFLCIDLLQVAFTFKLNSDETTAGPKKSVIRKPAKKKARISTIQGRSFDVTPTKSQDSSASPPSSSCTAEGITANENERKYNYCFLMGGSDMIDQLTDCPMGTCFDSTTSCCTRKACKNQGNPQPQPGTKPKPPKGNAEGPPKGSTPTTKDEPLKYQLFSADESARTSDDADMTSSEMAFFYRSFRERKQKNVCKGAVRCTRPGAFPSNHDRYSYYFCSRQRKSKNFIARHFRCPRRRCFKGNRCSRC